MFPNLPTAEIVTIGVATIFLYFLVVAILYGKQLVTTWGKTLHLSQAKTAPKPVQRNLAEASEQLLPPLIDKPGDHPDEQAGIYADYEMPTYELDNDQDNIMLKEAEQVVEQIQDVVDHIASHPANPDEVFTKIRAIVSQYSFFVETEYYDAINTFVAVTVERDCDLKLTPEDLQALWQDEAA